MMHIEDLCKETGDMARHALKTISLAYNGNTTLCMLCALSCMLKHEVYISCGLHFSCEKIESGPSCRDQMHSHWLQNVWIALCLGGVTRGWDPHEVTKTSRHYYCIKEVALLEYLNKCKRCSLHMLPKKKTESLGCL